MIAPSLEFQTLIYNTLIADAAVVAMGAAVYDNAPKNPAILYITIGDVDYNSRDAQCITAAEYNFTIHAWSKKKAKAECQDLCFAIKQALHLQKLTLSDHAISNIRAASGRVVRDPDGLTNHGTIQVSAIIEER